MAFKFAYTQSGGNPLIRDYPLATATNYLNAVGTQGVTPGDLVHLVSGLVERSIDATTPPANLGVVQGVEFMGITAGGTYAATNSSFNAEAVNTTNYPNGIVKVLVGKENVFKVPVASGTAAVANIGISYGIVQDTLGDQKVDLTETTNDQVTVVGIDKTGAHVFVTLI